MSEEPVNNASDRGNGEACDPQGPSAAPEKGLALADESPPAREAHDDDALRRENEELRDQLLRRRADFDNYRRRVERERATAGQDALAALLKELVSSLDNIERALQAPGDAAAVRDGVALIQRGLIATLESHGLRVDDPLGARFDPQNHQALSYDDAPGHAEGTISQVFAKGYFLKERLLRPALVQVARGTPAAGADGGSEPPAGAAADGEAQEAQDGGASVTDAAHE